MKRYTIAFPAEHVVARRFMAKPVEDWTTDEIAEVKADDELTVWEDMTLAEIKAAAATSSNKHLKATAAHLEMYED